MQFWQMRAQNDESYAPPPLPKSPKVKGLNQRHTKRCDDPRERENVCERQHFSRWRCSKDFSENEERLKVQKKT